MMMTRIRGQRRERRKGLKRCEEGEKKPISIEEIVVVVGVCGCGR